MKRNPKQDGSNLFDCIPQRGPCPNGCNQCYYNHGFYLPINTGHFPTLEEVGTGIVRVNSGHDSNINRNLVIESTQIYPKRFFNTSIPQLDFPDPVVFTANAKEEEEAYQPYVINRNNIMFVRLRVSSLNLGYVCQAAKEWGDVGVPVVLTFMRYYDEKEFAKQISINYTKRKSINNVYWCPNKKFMLSVLMLVSKFNSEIKMCGTLCKDCLNCEKYYYKTKERRNKCQAPGLVTKKD